MASVMPNDRSKSIEIVTIKLQRNTLMLKMFGGMIIGSMMTMMLLGGASVADQVLANGQTLYIDQINRPDGATTLLLLIAVSIVMGALTLWPSKRLMPTKQVIKRLRRHCK